MGLEIFSESSRCFESDISFVGDSFDVYREKSLCFDSECIGYRVKVTVGGQVFYCDRNNQIIEINMENKRGSFKCPHDI